MNRASQFELYQGWRVEGSVPRRRRVFPEPKEPQTRLIWCIGNRTVRSCSSNELAGVAAPSSGSAAPLSSGVLLGQVTVADWKAITAGTSSSSSAGGPEPSWGRTVTSGVSRYFSIRRSETRHWMAWTRMSGITLRAKLKSRVSAFAAHATRRARAPKFVPDGQGGECDRWRQGLSHDLGVDVKRDCVR